MRFIFFTKTDWNEPPRIRHQLATLLSDEGHEVLFFQKSRLTSRRETLSSDAPVALLRHPHLLHHQLKFVAPMRWLDAEFLKRQIRSLVTPRSGDVVVNFNYDFYFLSEIFPNKPIIHVVNDDFPAAAIWGNRSSAARIQAQTARDADHTLCVSYSILEQVRRATTACSLFLPWARHRYNAPPISRSRNEMLYWGYINKRLDFKIVNAILASGTRISFLGRVMPSTRAREMLNHPNASYHGVANLEDIPDVLSRCSCTILPYDASDDEIRCVTMSNRGFELLSFGLPLLYPDLPHLISAPNRVVYRCNTADDFIAAHIDAKGNYEDLQPDIAHFLEDHYPEKRYSQFMDIVQAASESRRASK